MFAMPMYARWMLPPFVFFIPIWIWGDILASLGKTDLTDWLVSKVAILALASVMLGLGFMLCAVIDRVEGQSDDDGRRYRQEH